MDQGSMSNSGFGTLRESGTLEMDQGSINRRVWNPKGTGTPKMDLGSKNRKYLLDLREPDTRRKHKS